MTILSIHNVSVGQVSVVPETVKMVSTDTLATITTAGYLNAANLQGIVLSPNTIIEMLYGYSLQTHSGTYGIFTVAISGTQITLTEWANPANVLLPVVSGDIASFNGTSGQIADSGILATNIVVKPTLPVVSGDLVTFTGTAGAIADSGLLASNIVLKNAVNTMAAGSSIVLAKVNGTEAANAVTASGVAGTITTSALTTAGGANYSITWTNTFISATSSVLMALAGGTNTTENFKVKITPGAGTATIIIYNNTAATALNGTIILSYAVF